MPKCIYTSLLFAYLSLLLQFHQTATVALNLPRSDPAADDSTLTNRVETDDETARNAGGQYSSTRTQQENPTSPPENCSSNASTATTSFNQSELLSSIRQYMMARLNLTETSTRTAPPVEIPPALLDSYQARLQAQEIRKNEPEECPEQKTTQYARSVNLYFPSNYESIADDNSEDKLYYEADKSKDAKEKDAPPPVLYDLTFSDLELASSSRLWSVILHLFKKKSHTSSRGVNPTESVKVFLVEKTGEIAKFETLLAAKILRSENEEYVSFDLTDGIKRWRNSSSEHASLGLSVFVDTPQSIDTNSRLPPAIVFDVPTYGKSEGQPQKPRLVVETMHNEESSTLHLNHGLRRRRKRSISGAVNSEFCFRNPTESNCCIRNLTVDIRRDLGLDHIILPAKYQPNYCRGSCHNSLWSSANLATKHLQDIRRTNPTAAAEPCCVPHSMKPLSVLMFLDNRVVVRDIPDMIVTSCICR